MRLRLMTILVLALLVSACSATRFGYNNADWFVGVYANRYLDLERDQRDWLRVRFREHMAWHRQSELPEYYLILGEFKARYERGLEVNDIDWLAEVAYGRYIALAERVIPDIAALTANLSPEQLAHFESRLHDDLEERIQDREDRRQRYARGEGEALQREYANAIIKRVEGWAGRLDANQRASIRDIVPWQPPSSDDDFIDRRRTRIQQYLEASAQGDAGRAQDLLVAWWVSPAQPDNERTAEAEARRDQFMDTVLTIDGLLSTRQRNRVARRVEAYRSDVARLAGVTE